MKKALLLILLSAVAVTVYSQEVTERKELAIFSLSHSAWKVPQGTLGLVDDAIKDVFINLGRFDVIGMNYRLTSDDINDFIDRIRAYKEANVEMPESVLLGEEAFTEADFNRLVGSFIVVIPSVTYYRTGRTEGGSFRADIKTSFTFINIEELETIDHFSIDTIGLDPTSIREAVKEAAEDIPVQLTYEIRRMPEFQLKTGIIDIMGQDVLIEFGENMGVKKGDEFAIVRTRILDSGHRVTDETGLLVIREVKEEVSIAHVVYAKGKPMVGDQVKEVPRLGFDTSLYLHMAFDLSDISRSVIMLGIKQSASRGLYTFRPLISLEIPLIITGRYGFPLNLSLGGEINWYIRRFQVVSMASVGIGGVFVSSTSTKSASGETAFELTNAGFKTGVSLNYLLGSRTRMFLDGGYTYWFGFGLGANYGGPFAGFGVQIKY